MRSHLINALFGLATICVIAGCDGTIDSTISAQNVLPSNVEELRCELRLELPAIISRRTPSRGKVKIANTGNSDVILVMPGDGSNCRWRTPIVGWSVLPAEATAQHPKEPPSRSGARCGNINRLRPNDVFTLKSGETKELNDWIGSPFGLSPGKYRAVFYYSNLPQLKWSGFPLGAHDSDAMEQVKSSTEIALVSNEVEFTVVE